MKRIATIAVALICIIAMSACSNNSAKKVDLAKAMQDINTECNITTTKDLTAEELTSYYLIEESDVTSFSAEIDIKGITEIVLIEAKDEQASKKVADLLEKRLTSKTNEAASYEPELLEIIKNTEVTTNNNYVSMIICEDTDKAKKIYDKAFE